MVTRVFRSPVVGIIAVISLAAAVGVRAEQVFSPLADPFPTGSRVVMKPADPGYFETPFGYVEEIVLSDFDLTSSSPSGDEMMFLYAASFYVEFLDKPGGTVVGSYTGTSKDFSVNVFGRKGVLELGAKRAAHNAHSFTGDVVDTDGRVVAKNFVTRTNPAITSTGTVTFSGPSFRNGMPGMMVDTEFTVFGQYSVDAGNSFADAPLLTAVSEIAPKPAAPCADAGDGQVAK